MTFPPKDASALIRAVFADYFSRRLARSGFDDLAGPVDAATTAMLAAAREVDDLERPLGRTIADRDEVAEAMDDSAQLSRMRLAARSVGATRRIPYLLVFPKGVAYYLDATLTERKVRYDQLVDRLVSSLPDTDPVRIETVAALGSQLAAWVVAEEGVGDARNVVELARTRREVATAAWKEAIDRSYGHLVTRVGRIAAERYFPKARRNKGKATPAAEPSAPPVPPHDPPDEGGA